MKTWTFVFGLCIGAVGTVGVLAPAGLAWIAEQFVASGRSGFYLIAAVRVAFGALLIFVASASRAPRSLRLLGGVIVILGIATAATGLWGVERARAAIDWWLHREFGVLRLTGGVLVALGGFVAYACAPGASAVTAVDRGDSPAILVPPPFVFLGALALGLALEALRPTSLVMHALPFQILGAVLVAVGMALSVSVVHLFRRAGTPVSPRLPTQRLVSSGPYRFSRNPDYLGQVLAISGLALVLNTFWVLVFVLPGLVAVRYGVIAREEHYLEDRFGDEYRGYRRRVRRWL